MPAVAAPVAMPAPAPSALPPTEAGAAAVVARLGERGLLEPRALERARRADGGGGAAGRPDLALTRLGLVSERLMAESYAEVLGLPLAHAPDFPDEPLLPGRLKARFLRAARAVPLRLDPGPGGALELALVDPLDRFTPAAVGAATGRPVRLAVAVPVELDGALDRLYPKEGGAPGGDGDGHAAGHGGHAGHGAGGHGHHEPGEDDAERLRDLASEAPVVRLVNQLVFRAVETKASDIHLEPTETGLRVRLRHDGVLHESEPPPPALSAAVVSRVKIMARLDIAERRLPQDGRIKLAVRGQEVDFRVSTVPSQFGETVVLRVLDRSAVELDLAKLGLTADVRDGLRRVLELPNGIVLVTGPTGSGKTTTLYAALTLLDSATRKIVTVEDPIEYQIRGISQTQVKPGIGLTFASLLRSILRQDPDVIMIGEIRDLETAQIAVQAALTGHLVLSTLHTNSAAASLTRLRDMGLESYLLSATLNAALGQRLVRRLCARCKRPAEASPEVVARFGLDRLARGPGPILLHEPVGCPACRNTGFRGRMAVSEIVPMGERLRRLVLKGEDEAAIQAAAAEEAGARTMFENGAMAVLDGLTTLPELVRSVRFEG